MRSEALAVLFAVGFTAGCGSGPDVVTQGAGDAVRACDGQQVDVRSNPNHCGRCGQACGPPGVCRDGTCQGAGGGPVASSVCARGETHCGSLCCPGGTACTTNAVGVPECQPVRQKVKACGAGEMACGAAGCCPQGQTCGSVGTGMSFCSVPADFTTGEPVCETGTSCQGWCCVESACVTLPSTQDICG